MQGLVNYTRVMQLTLLFTRIKTYTMKHDIEQLKSQFDAKPNAEYTLPDEDNKQMIINNNKASGNNTVSDSNASTNNNTCLLYTSPSPRD